MTRPIDQLAGELTAALDRALGAGAVVLLEELRTTLGVQAPTVMRGGRRVATEPATPGAPPRMVTGNLWEHLDVEHPEPGVWEVGVRVRVPYARKLEKMGHPYFLPALERALPRVEAVVGQAVRAEVS